MRIEVRYIHPGIDGRVKRLEKRLRRQFIELKKLELVDVYLVQGIPGFTRKTAESIFADTVVQRVDCLDSEEFPGARKRDVQLPHFGIEISYRPGVTDTVALTAEKAIKTAVGEELSAKGIVQTARQYRFWGIGEKGFSRSRAIQIAETLYNPLIQRAQYFTPREENALPLMYPGKMEASPPGVEEFSLAEYSDEALQELSKKRLLALSLEELKSIRDYYRKRETLESRKKKGLPPGAVDVELEMIAQTWSEHCKHKIFQAEIEYLEEGNREVIQSLFNTYIKKTTEEVSKKKEYLRSVFHDNSGVMQFDEETLICFKAETHNSPSALDPYGGAITGIVGVNRDILGTGLGAKPIFNTNVLCFGYPDTGEENIPRGLFHPRDVMEGVHRGIVDGGNQSGIPVVAGGFLFDEDYTGKPLVYCGTGGVIPSMIGKKAGWEKDIRPGYKAVMLGGRIGKDGIHGATFSSEVLNETSPTSAVQIGDPIVQKVMTDFLLEARDLDLYQGITDNGAGGLSSSLGEMAEISGGVRIDLETCPLKYQGLAPWEILLSESQERMSLAVEPEKIGSFLTLAKKRDVEATVVGEFTNSGGVDICYDGKIIGFLELSFLHNGLPPMRLKAEWQPPERLIGTVKTELTCKEILLRLLGEPNIASKEPLIRQYDHEVQGRTMVRPFTGIHQDGPTDGGVVKPRYDSWRGITITHGICPWYSPIDTYHMASCAVDEAYRSHIALGGNPELTGGLDNFCWPDPVQSPDTPDGSYKLAQLVRACKGLQDTCIAYGIPLISGKDSMKNDARLDGKKVSVKPTLLVSLMGIIDDVRNAVTSDFKNPGDLIFCVGKTRGELGGTFIEKLLKQQLGKCPEVYFSDAKKNYQSIARAIDRGILSSCHDISDGGLAVSVMESAIGGQVGGDIDITGIIGESGDKEADIIALFCETPSRFIATLPEKEEKSFLDCFSSEKPLFLGRVTEEKNVTFCKSGKALFNCSIQEAEKAWKGYFYGK